MSTIEIVASIVGLVSVYLTVRENVWCWPTGIVMVILYIFIFYDAKFYSDMGLQVIYIFLQIYGWMEWARGGDKSKKLAVTQFSKQYYIGVTAVIIIIGTGSIGYVMDTYTDASLPYPDAFVTATSLVAQYLMARKNIECWPLWIIVDVVAIVIFFMKDLRFTAALYVAFLFLATNGFFAWRKSYIETQPA